MRFCPMTRVWHSCYNITAANCQQSANTANFLYFNLAKSGQMDLPFWHLWFCIVNCPCKAEVMHWSPSLHKADTEFLRKFGVSACSISKVILKISSVTSLLQYSCWEPTIHCRFINTLLRYDLLWWFAPEKNCVVLAAFWDKKSIFHLGQKEHWSLIRAIGWCFLCSALCLLQSFDVVLPSAKNQAE